MAVVALLGVVNGVVCGVVVVLLSGGASVGAVVFVVEGIVVVLLVVVSTVVAAVGVVEGVVVFPGFVDASMTAVVLSGARVVWLVVWVTFGASVLMDMVVFECSVPVEVEVVPVAFTGTVTVVAFMKTVVLAVAPGLSVGGTVVGKLELEPLPGDVGSGGRVAKVIVLLAPSVLFIVAFEDRVVVNIVVGLWGPVTSPSGVTEELVVAFVWFED